MRISLPAGTSRRLFNPFLFAAVYVFTLPGAHAQSRDGSYIAAFRSSKHVMASKPEVFHDAVE